MRDLTILLILNRSRHRAPNLRASDRILAGVCALLMRPARVFRSAIVLRPSTVLNFHRTLRTRKYRLLFSPKRRRTGPKGPPKALVDAIVAIKRRNPTWGCPRIAQQIALAFDIDIGKDVVRPRPGGTLSTGPGREWTLVADVPRAREGQSVECRPVSVRVRDPAHALGVGRDGPVHTTDRWLRGPGRHCGRPGPLPHVQPRDWQAVESDVSQFGPRSAVPVPPMAREPSGAAGDRGQDRPLRPAVPSVRRTVDRHPAPRRFGSDAVLVRAGLGTEAVGIPDLLQRASGPHVVGRAATHPDTRRGRRAYPSTDGSRIAAVSIRRRSRRDR